MLSDEELEERARERDRHYRKFPIPGCHYLVEHCPGRDIITIRDGFGHEAHYHKAQLIDLMKEIQRTFILDSLVSE